MQKQYFDIKYPFTNVSFENYEIDLNEDRFAGVTSNILHLIFTPKGQRLRMPDFGTNLIEWIFSPSHDDTWEGVKDEVRTSVSKWIENVSIKDIQVMASEDGRQIYVRIDYQVTEGNSVYDNSVAVEL